MSQGRVYLWKCDPTRPLDGQLQEAVVGLPDLERDVAGRARLSGRLVRVRNDGSLNVLDPITGEVRALAIGDASPDEQGNFLFEPGRGGGRVDKVRHVPSKRLQRYTQSSRFGEVNTYYHLHRIASYVDELLEELGAASLPLVTAVVNAHHAATEWDGIRDGERGTNRWMPFQGGHYRLPSRRYNIAEYRPISPNGEIHLGPGWQLLEDGALPRLAMNRYRANASHNAGILYHEYAHHITRHTADLRGNALRSPEGQDNRKSALDEGTCDYWAATMLETPHIWAWHRRHTADEIHPRSLASRRTMDDYDAGPQTDPHANGTIWAAALWDLRSRLLSAHDDGARQTDLLLLKALLLLGQMPAPAPPPTARALRRARSSFPVALAALLRADEMLHSGRHRRDILDSFARRKIVPSVEGSREHGRPGHLADMEVSSLLRKVPREEIPDSGDIYSAAELEADLQKLNEPALSLVAAGDVMLGDRTARPIRERGPDYPFAAVLPLLRRACIGFANLEGPFAKRAGREERHFSYRVDPELATSLARARVNVVTLANNHLLDCGRAGVLETLDALGAAGVAAVGAAVDEASAHRPVILPAGRWRVGLLGYYWNRRTAAVGALPGSATDAREHLAADIGALRERADRVVVAFHWGIPYRYDPLPEDREKARFAVDCGADAVIGHHPHVVQPLEIHRGCPIFYSVGNLALGSGNSYAEGLLVGFRFEEHETVVQVYPLYVKNRDPRVDYQPKVLRGTSAERVLGRLAEVSGSRGGLLRVEAGRGILRLPRGGRRGAAA
jgi:poly-gamma-glutamate capsule biosynthesis protein CapA/YwtB (metallophosphatase superfamily)